MSNFQFLMPRSRRRHHSRSRSRSRSHSHERDREPKRRKIDNYESPHHRRTVSSEPEANDYESQKQISDDNSHEVIEVATHSVDTSAQNQKVDEFELEEQTSHEKDDAMKESGVQSESDDEVVLVESDDSKNSNSEASTPSKFNPKQSELEITPKKDTTPKQTLKKLDSEKKRVEKQKEKEERELKKQREKEEREVKKQKEKEGKNRAKEERLKQKQEKDEQKLKEKQERQEQRQKEKEIKEQRRREKEEKDEQKRKEREQEKLKRQQEIDEKNREKQKLEEQKQKAAAVFVNFFVTKKPQDQPDEKKCEPTIPSNFMPFEVKSDMRLVPSVRRILTEHDKCVLDQALQTQAQTLLYLGELKQGKTIGESGKTWPLQDEDVDDVLIIEETALGETIVEQKPKLQMRAKFFKFHENQRPPYFGTWRKRSRFVRSRKPFGLDKDIFNYEVDSDDEWEEEGEGESLKGSDEDEKENGSDNDYEVDNEFFVPHGHLSDDEVDDEQNAKLSPESHKAKLKLLKNEFDEEMKSKTQKIKPRVIGCVWYNKAQDNIEEAIHRYLQPYSMITNGQVHIKKRSSITSSTQKKTARQLEKEHIPLFLKLIHGSVKKRKVLVNEYLEILSNNGIQAGVSKLALGRQFRQLAQWMKCPEQGVMHNKLCWYVGEDVRKEFGVDLVIPNKWEAIRKKDAAVE